MTETTKSIILHYNTGRPMQYDGVTLIEKKRDYYRIEMGKAVVIVRHTALRLHEPIEEVT